MSRPTTPGTKKKMKPRKKLITSRWPNPPAELCEGSSAKGTQSNATPFTACRCLPASNSITASRTQQSEQQGTQMKPIKLNQTLPTETAPLDLSATSSEDTSNSLTEELNERTRDLNSQDVVETESRDKEESEPTLESKSHKTVSHTKNSLQPFGRKPGPLANVRANQKMSKRAIEKPNQNREAGEVGTEDMEDDGLTNKEKEEIHLRGKATLMKVCMDSCTKPIYQKKGGFYEGKYHNVDAIVDAWKADIGETTLETNDVVPHSNEPMMERGKLRSHAGQRTEHGRGRHREGNITQGLGNVNQPKPLRSDDLEPEMESINRYTTQGPIHIEQSQGASANGIIRPSPQEEEEEISEEELWCEDQCNRIVWGPEMKQETPQIVERANYEHAETIHEPDMTAFRDRRSLDFIEEPQMTSVGLKRRNNEEEVESEDEEFSSWCDRTCEKVARLPEMWTALEPRRDIIKKLMNEKFYSRRNKHEQLDEPEVASTPAKNRRFANKRNLKQVYEMTEAERDKRIQRMTQLCRDVCTAQRNKEFKSEAEVKQVSKKRNAKERAKLEQEKQQYEAAKDNFRQNIVNLCMDRCDKVMARGPVQRRVRQNVKVDQAKQAPPEGLCEGMRSLCEKLADDLVEQHYKYGPVTHGYTFDLQEPELQSSKRATNESVRQQKKMSRRPEERDTFSLKESSSASRLNDVGPGQAMGQPESNDQDEGPSVSSYGSREEFYRALNEYEDAAFQQNKRPNGRQEQNEGAMEPYRKRSQEEASLTHGQGMAASPERELTKRQLGNQNPGQPTQPKPEQTEQGMQTDPGSSSYTACDHANHLEQTYGSVPGQSPRTKRNEDNSNTATKDSQHHTSQPASLQSTSSSRVMFADDPVTQEKRSVSPTITVTSKSSSQQESCNHCGHPKYQARRCANCFEGNVREAKEILGGGNATVWPSDHQNRPLPHQQPQDSPGLFVLSDTTVEPSHHNLTCCAQAEARQRLISQKMKDVLGLHGVHAIVTEKTKGGCTWGVNAYLIR